MTVNTHLAGRLWHAGALLLSCAIAGCPSPPQKSTETPAPSAAQPTKQPDKKKVVVLLVVDQLPSWTFSRHLAAFRGGFARLVREGTYFPIGEYPYAATVTAIGHAALATGAEPRRSGIVGNTWWDNAASRWIEATTDESRPTVPPLAADDGASPKWRVAEAVGAGRRVLSVSYKERAAILMAPSTGAVVTWYEPRHRAFVTSAQYAEARPAWLDDLAREHPIGPRLGSTWTPLDATPSRALVPDSSPGETGAYGLGSSFPHALASSKSPEAAVGATPLASELVLEAVLAGLEAVDPELLAVSFSAHDLAGHSWGQESWEATDVLFRLDEAIGRLLDALDARWGADGWSLVFSSDHGAPRLPERTPGAARVDLADVMKVVHAAAGGAKWIAAADERMIYLSAAARAQPDAARSKMLDAIASAVGKMPGIGFALRTDPFAKNEGCTKLSEMETLVCRSVYPGRAGDVYYGPREGSFVQRRPFEANTHGSPYGYDREVPIVVREPGRAPRVAADERPSVLRIAPTLARLLGAPAPPAAREAPL